MPGRAAAIDDLGRLAGRVGDRPRAHQRGRTGRGQSRRQRQARELARIEVRPAAGEGRRLVALGRVDDGHLDVGRVVVAAEHVDPRLPDLGRLALLAKRVDVEAGRRQLLLERRVGEQDRREHPLLFAARTPIGLLWVEAGVGIEGHGDQQPPLGLARARLAIGELLIGPAPELDLARTTAGIDPRDRHELDRRHADVGREHPLADSRRTLQLPQDLGPLEVAFEVVVGQRRRERIEIRRRRVRVAEPAHVLLGRGRGAGLGLLAGERKREQARGQPRDEVVRSGEDRSASGCEHAPTVASLGARGPSSRAPFPI